MITVENRDGRALVELTTSMFRTTLEMPAEALRREEGRILLESWLTAIYFAPGLTIPACEIDELLNHVDIMFPLSRQRSTRKLQIREW